ncbi:hypothetical protein J2S43_006068 [Catenuloplanes nepalensis]|uniref:Uncharacterized protein n=1 Tax=Catenuloplanes nepalensis TaxID=587533 RepID=A0ABT9N2N9_9ACTN|nr:hypothetical protein [Catenuloplanes nepalensis]MDP9797556.1 hypothetical protein [Catenuloplanes nepalensis]
MVGSVSRVELEGGVLLSRFAVAAEDDGEPAAAGPVHRDSAEGLA